MEPFAALRPPRAVFFDVGGTLLETNAEVDSALFTALVPVDPLCTIAQVRQAMRAAAPDLPARQPPFFTARANPAWWVARYAAVAVELGLAEMDSERFVATAAEDHVQGDALHVFADAPAALARLAARGVILGVISNWDRGLDAVLARKGLLRYFGVVVASGVVGATKPARAIFEYALAEAGVTAAEAWHVGDDPSADAAGAQAAGLSALLLDTHDLYRRCEGNGIARARTLSAAVDRMLAPGTP